MEKQTLSRGKIWQWFHDTSGYWTFGIFMLTFLAALGGVGAWALYAQSAIHEAVVSEVANVSKVEIKRINARVDDNKELLRRMDLRFDTMDAKFDAMEAKLDILVRIDERTENLEKNVDLLIRKSLGLSDDSLSINE